jgi:hypothetical protein
MSLRGKQNCVAGNKLPTSYGLRESASETQKYKALAEWHIAELMEVQEDMFD